MFRDGFRGHRISLYLNRQAGLDAIGATRSDAPIRPLPFWKRIGGDDTSGQQWRSSVRNENRQRAASIPGLRQAGWPGCPTVMVNATESLVIAQSARHPKN